MLLPPGGPGGTRPAPVREAVSKDCTGGLVAHKPAEQLLDLPGQFDRSLAQQTDEDRYGLRIARPGQRRAASKRTRGQGSANNLSASLRGTPAARPTNCAAAPAQRVPVLDAPPGPAPAYLREDQSDPGPRRWRPRWPRRRHRANRRAASRWRRGAGAWPGAGPPNPPGCFAPLALYRARHSPARRATSASASKTAGRRTARPRNRRRRAGGWPFLGQQKRCRRVGGRSPPGVPAARAKASAPGRKRAATAHRSPRWLPGAAALRISHFRVGLGARADDGGQDPGQDQADTTVRHGERPRRRRANKSIVAAAARPVKWLNCSRSSPFGRSTPNSRGNQAPVSALASLRGLRVREKTGRGRK